MHVFSIFQISIYLLTACAGGMLAQAEGGMFSPQMLTPVLALIAFFFNEQQQKLVLPNVGAGVLGVVAFLLAWAEFRQDDIESRLLAGAHLIVYLTWIVLFQRKKAREYWTLCAMSGLHVAVGSVLISTSLFGMELVAFFCLTLWTLSVFSLHQAQQSFSRVEAMGIATPTLQGEAVAGLQPNGMTWAGLSLQQETEARGAVQRDPQENWINRRFVGGYVGSVVLALVIAWIFFLFIPRIWIGQQNYFDRKDPSGSTALTGFTREVQLGDIGEILESTAPVMRVELFDDRSGEQLDIERYAVQLGYSEPLFRGAVLELYSNGRWSAGDTRGGYRAFFRSPRRVNTVRQEIELMPVAEDLLFAMHPIEACGMRSEKDPIAVHVPSGRLVRPGAKVFNTKPADYFLHSPAQADGPPTATDFETLFGVRSRTTLLRNKQFPQATLQNLQALAETLTEVEPGQPELTVKQKVDALVNYLRDSGEFSYTLNLSITDPSIDPVEDFLFNRKAGHCEYFASALALMLRSLDIPARVVTGFKGGVNSSGLTFEVQQRHAHAWVEAYVSRQWITLDATPADARTASVESMGGKIRSWSDLKSFLKGFWNQSVLNLSITDQRRRLYEPLLAELKSWWSAIAKNGFRLAGIYEAIRKFVTTPERWFSFRGGLVTFLFLWFLALVLWLGRRVYRLIRWLIAGVQEKLLPSGMEVDFYERFRELCESQGHTRGSTQTPREYAIEVQRQANVELQRAGLGTLPDTLVDAFYQVRFGGRPIPPEQHQQLFRQLEHLERSWSQPEPA